jgi:hypothetical protein
VYVRLKRFPCKGGWVEGEDGYHQTYFDAAGRWRRKLSGEMLLVAQMVEDRRENGGTRRRVVSHLGSVRAGSGPVSRRRFWDEVDHHLDELGINGGDRACVEHRLSDEIFRPTDAEVAAEYRAWAQNELTIAAIATHMDGNLEKPLARDTVYRAEADRLTATPTVLAIGEETTPEP